ncbi:type I Iterative Polyketide synthase (PKS) [Aspergillus brasiliensis]|nr:type I Iterative Polyketide synthase (PKS) [Aspergillus brasiliensis]
MGSLTADGFPADHVPYEPIAIVGMACRLPGSITSPSSLWDTLVNKKSVQTPNVPKSRFSIDAFYHKNLNRPGSFNVRGDYFLDGSPNDFDPSFFGMTPIEAMWLDPQQQRILEVTYECLENAGLRLEDVAGKNIGAFVGCFTSDYQQLLHREPDFRHEYAATGTDPGLLSARICNIFDLCGPSAVIDSACSSSMTAIHQACQALQTGECDGAIAGGVNLIISVDQHMNTAKPGNLSPTSTCHTFDAAADGYGRAEGAGAIYLCRLSDAIRKGYPIRAVIRGSALNTNGKAKNQGITHPSLEGQERVLRAAYKGPAWIQQTHSMLNAMVNACNSLTTQRVAETFLGTGTPVGDPIEVRAISNGMNEKGNREQPLLLGAIKANIGHSEAVSGIFAVIKAALMVESGVIPGVAGLKTLNPALKEDEWNVKINVDTRPWPESPLPRRVGVSSFGYGGTNGHVILEAVQSDPWRPRFKPEYEHSSPGKALRNIEAHGGIVENHHLQDLAYTLNCRRTHFSHRAFTVATEGQEVENFSKQSFEFNVTEHPGQIAFAFTVQGAQWVGMGKDAMHSLPAFSTTIRYLDQYMRTLQSPVAWTIEEALLGNIDSDRIAQPDIAQPLCTAIQIAIVDQLGTWGVSPSAVVGHSSGGIAAAYAAGMLSAREAFANSFYRGQAVAQKSPAGSMLAVGVGVDRIKHYIRDTEVVVACENSPESVTLSGSKSAIERLITQLEASGVFARELRTGRPYHSPAMESVAPLYEHLLRANLQADSSASERQSRVPMISSVTGREVHGEDMKPEYWVQNLKNRVRFHTAITELVGMEQLKDLTHFVEIGPHSVLTGPLKQIMSTNDRTRRIKYIPTIIRESDSCNDLLRVAGRLFLSGYNVRLQEVTQDLSKKPGPRLLVDLPPYQWNYATEYWRETRLSQEQRQQSQPRHDLLGRRVAGLSDTSYVWKNILRLRDVPWLKDHRVGSEVLLPGAAYIAIAIEALWQISATPFSPSNGACLKDFEFQQGLVIPDTDYGIEIMTQLSRQSNKGSGWYTFTVESLLDNQWTTHCSGLITARKTKQKIPWQPHEQMAKTLHQRTHPDSAWETSNQFYAVTLVVKDNPDQLLTMGIVETLQGLELAVDVVHLHETNHAFHHNTVILDVDGSILSNPSETQFDMLKKLVFPEGNVLLWLTWGVHQGRTAEGGLSLGFLRDVRSEHPGAKILSLDVNWEEPHHSIGQALVTVLGAAAPRGSGHETEFWLHEGILHTSRLVPWACPSTSPKGRDTVKLPLNMPLQSEFMDGELIFRANESPIIDSTEDEICLQVEMTEYQDWACDQRTKHPVIAVGHTIPNQGESTPRLVVTLVAERGYQTIIQTKKGVCFECEDLDPALLCAKLPTICRFLLCMNWLGRVQKDDHILLLHMPQVFVQLAISFSRELDAQITVVVATQDESDELYEASLSGVPIIVVEDVHASHMSPVLEATSGAFSLGRFFSAGGLPIPRYTNRNGAEILRDGLDILKKNRDIWTSNVPVYSIDQLPIQPYSHQYNASLHSGEEVNAAVQFDYGESPVK